MLQTKYIVKRDFEYTPGVTMRQGDEFIPAGQPNDRMIMRAPNLVRAVVVEVDDPTQPELLAVANAPAKARTRARKGGKR